MSPDWPPCCLPAWPDRSQPNPTPYPHVRRARIVSVAASAVLACVVFGFVSSHLSGVRVAVGTVRVGVVGTATLAATYGAGIAFTRLGAGR